MISFQELLLFLVIFTDFDFIFEKAIAQLIAEFPSMKMRKDSPWEEN